MSRSCCRVFRFSSTASVSGVLHHSGKTKGIYVAFASDGRYFLLPAFFHGNYSGMYYAGDSYGDGTGAVSKP